MDWKSIRYIFLVCLIAFIIWIIGELILMFVFPDSTLTAARIWVIAVFSAACIWNIRHFYKAEKKKQEDEDNENYKGVY
jgi:uncharacterized membrane protein YqjE